MKPSGHHVIEFRRVDSIYTCTMALLTVLEAAVLCKDRCSVASTLVVAERCCVRAADGRLAPREAARHHSPALSASR